jgi:hypothetical protein
VSRTTSPPAGTSTSLTPDIGLSSSDAGDKAVGDGKERPALLEGKLEVFLNLLDGKSKRRLRVSSPVVDVCSPQCLLLGAGTAAVNGTYDLVSFRDGAPLYENSSTRITIQQANFGGQKGWLIARPPKTIFYGQPCTSDTPPDVHWALMLGGEGINPPPTLMMTSTKRANEEQVNKRQVTMTDARGEAPLHKDQSLEIFNTA